MYIYIIWDFIDQVAGGEVPIGSFGTSICLARKGLGLYGEGDWWDGEGVALTEMSNE